MLGDSAMANLSPRYEPHGWIQWPENEAYSFQFMKVLGLAQEGASTISECFLTASRIIPGDNDSWCREWRNIAQESVARAKSALMRGNIETAKNNWLRASSYFRTAGVFLAPSDKRAPPILAEMENCSRCYLAQMKPIGEVIQIPGENQRGLSAYFLKAPGAPPKTPVIIGVSVFEEMKDDQLHNLPRHAFARGLSLLLVNLPQVQSFDAEIPIGLCVDYLWSRDDVDTENIVLYGSKSGGSCISRAASQDHRFKAAVCDGGMWDQLERVAILEWTCNGRRSSDRRSRSSDRRRSKFAELSKRLKQYYLARKISCPVLVVAGEYDSLDTKYMLEYCRRAKETGSDIQLKIFSASETGASAGQIDNPTLGHEFVFDWIAGKVRLGRSKRPAKRLLLLA
jgi:hypothetical protein